MSDFPINYAFVRRKTIALKEEDGTVKDYTVLVLDEKANDSYFKKVQSFQDTIVKCPELDKLQYWAISESFADTAVIDLMKEDYVESFKLTGVQPEDHTIFGIKVLITKDIDTPVCWLHYGEDKRIENTTWQ